MTPQNEVGQSWRARWLAAQEAIEKSEPLFTVSVLFGTGGVIMARAAWDHDIFGVVISAACFYVLGPVLAKWRHKRKQQDIGPSSK